MIRASLPLRSSSTMDSKHLLRFSARYALTDDGPLAAARAYADRRDGANALWTQIAAHLRDRCG